MPQITVTPESLGSYFTAATNDLFPRIEHLKQVTSTNDFCLRLSQTCDHNVVCVTDHQTDGRGRRGNVWASQPGDLCFSLLWRTPLQLEQLSGLSLVIALAIATALSEYELPEPIQVKWPNDLFCREKKLGGILIESTQQNRQTAVVIGVGVNLHALKHPDDIPQPAISLADLLDRIDTNSILANIINHLSQSIILFSKAGLGTFTQVWRQHDMTFQKRISVLHNQNQITGICEGISDNGELLLRLDNGEQLAIHSGSIQLET